MSMLIVAARRMFADNSAVALSLSFPLSPQVALLFLQYRMFADAHIACVCFDGWFAFTHFTVSSEPKFFLSIARNNFFIANFFGFELTSSLALVRQRS